MFPEYYSENAFSIYNESRHSFTFVVNTSEGSKNLKLEDSIFELFRKGKEELLRERYALALNSFRELSLTILRSIYPTLPSVPEINPYLAIPLDLYLLNPLIFKTGELIKKALEDWKVSQKSEEGNEELPEELNIQMRMISQKNFRIAQNDPKVLVFHANQKGNSGDWKEAKGYYQEALDLIRTSEYSDRKHWEAGIYHDLAIVREKLVAKNDGEEKNNIISSCSFARNVFRELGDGLKEIHSSLTLEGLDQRIGENLKENFEYAKNRYKKLNLSGKDPALDNLMKSNSNSKYLIDPPKKMLNGKYGQLIKPGLYYFCIQGHEGSQNILLNEEVEKRIESFLKNRVNSDDLGILSGLFNSPLQMLANLPHLYFFIIPMAIADCEIGMSRYENAAELLISVLKYPYINNKAEIAKLWMRLADIYLALGDEAYKKAGYKKDSYEAAKKYYEILVRTDNTIDSESPLYKDANFANIKTRIATFLESDPSFKQEDNPALLYKIAEAQTKLLQIKNMQNYFGLPEDYIPPFSFEYLQNTAKYFAHHATQMEQKYIQYKSTAERDELRHDQLDQQIELAEQTIILERRGLSEAETGGLIARRNLIYAGTKEAIAEQEKNLFNVYRWRLLEIAQIEAWSNANVEGGNTRQNIYGRYYFGKDLSRVDVLRQMAMFRTSINHTFEGARLQNEVYSANAYKQVIQGQLFQAEARIAIARQRMKVAELQLRQARENREFLDTIEFGIGVWYELAKQTKKLVQKYVDMATEISMLMEKAYNAETERNLSLIRYDYIPADNNILTGADQLLHDIDFFTYDYVTNVKAKKSSVKKIISLSNQFPIAFNRLKETGGCQFHTRLEDFDRDHPGLYLCKIQYIELELVGISRGASVAGTLGNVGVSRFRLEDGKIVSRMYPSDVMVLSQFDIRNDVLVFRFDPKDLRLFENHGLETIWELKLFKDANDFDSRDLLDVQMVVYYDGLFNPELEENIRSSLPTTGEGSKAVSMNLLFPDELFYLQTNGEAVLEVDQSFFPFFQTNLQRSWLIMKVLGKQEWIKGLKLRLYSSRLDQTISIQTDEKGEIDESFFQTLKGKPIIDTWIIAIKEEDNPNMDIKELENIDDLLFLFGYDFQYRN